MKDSGGAAVYPLDIPGSTAQSTAVANDAADGADPADGARAAAADAQVTTAGSSTSWECPLCNIFVDNDSDCCDMCSSTRPKTTPTPTVAKLTPTLKHPKRGGRGLLYGVYERRRANKRWCIKGIKATLCLMQRFEAVKIHIQGLPIMDEDVNDQHFMDWMLRFIVDHSSVASDAAECISVLEMFNSIEATMYPNDLPAEHRYREYCKRNEASKPKVGEVAALGRRGDNIPVIVSRVG